MEHSRLVEMLAASTAAFGPAGFEAPVRDVIRGYAERVADRVDVDAAGNLVATLRGGGGPAVLLTAHLDEVGLMVSHVEDDGWLRLAPIGGWEATVLPAQRLRFLTPAGNPVVGVVGSLPPHIRDAGERKALKLTDLAVDVGAATAADVAAMGLDVGAPAVPDVALAPLGSGAVTAKALDDRAGCVAVLEALRALAAKRPRADVVAVFTVGEERDGAGAGHAARATEPCLVLVVETTVAADIPGVPAHRHVTRVGGGPAITVMDRLWTAAPDVVAQLRGVAADSGIRVQSKQPGVGSTDAAAWRRERPELRCAVVSTPCRGIHSAGGVLRLGDLAGTAALLEAAVRAAA